MGVRCSALSCRADGGSARGRAGRAHAMLGRMVGECVCAGGASAGEASAYNSLPQVHEGRIHSLEDRRPTRLSTRQPRNRPEGLLADRISCAENLGNSSLSCRVQDNLHRDAARECLMIGVVHVIAILIRRFGLLGILFQV